MNIEEIIIKAVKHVFDVLLAKDVAKILGRYQSIGRYQSCGLILCSTNFTVGLPLDCNVKSGLLSLYLPINLG